MYLWSLQLGHSQPLHSHFYPYCSCFSCYKFARFLNLFIICTVPFCVVQYLVVFGNPCFRQSLHTSSLLSCSCCRVISLYILPSQVIIATLSAKARQIMCSVIHHVLHICLWHLHLIPLHYLITPIQHYVNFILVTVQTPVVPSSPLFFSVLSSICLSIVLQVVYGILLKSTKLLPSTCF